MAHRLSLAQFSTRVDDSSAPALAALRTLTHVDLGRTRVGEAAVLALAALPVGRLRAIGLGDTSVRERHTAHLCAHVARGAVLSTNTGQPLIAMTHCNHAREGSLMPGWAQGTR